MNTMQVEVVSGEEQIFSGEASFIVVPTVTGELGLYPKHEPIMSLVRPGALKVTKADSKEEEEEVLVAISGGVLEVQPNKVTILADVAVRSEAMDRDRAEKAKQMAQEALQNAQDDESQAKAQAALAAAIAELKTLEHLRAAHKK